jgi:hypothetical protein
MRKVTGKQMKTVWRKEEFQPRINTDKHGLPPGELSEENIRVHPCPSVVDEFSPVWTMTAPGGDEKTFGKHPTQKPVALIERCLLASTHEGDLVLDPFLGGGTTAVACVRLKRGCVGIELDDAHARLAIIRADRETVLIWLRTFQVRVSVSLAPRFGGERARVRGAEKNGLLTPTLSSFGEEREKLRCRQIDLDLFSETINGSGVDDKPELPAESIYHEP